MYRTFFTGHRKCLWPCMTSTSLFWPGIWQHGAQALWPQCWQTWCACGKSHATYISAGTCTQKCCEKKTLKKNSFYECCLILIVQKVNCLDEFNHRRSSLVIELHRIIIHLAPSFGGIPLMILTRLQSASPSVMFFCQHSSSETAQQNFWNFVVRTWCVES